MSHGAVTPRRHETPNAVMQTYASRDLAGTDLAVWRVEMAPGSSGPVHSVDVEQVLVVLQGELHLDMDGATADLASDMSAVLPASAQRCLTNQSAEPAVAIVCSHSGARASTAERGDVPIPWAE